MYKRQGKGAIMRLGTNTRVVVESIPTGSVALEMCIRDRFCGDQSQPSRL